MKGKWHRVKICVRLWISGSAGLPGMETPVYNLITRKFEAGGSLHSESLSHKINSSIRVAFWVMVPLHLTHTQSLIVLAPSSLVLKCWIWRPWPCAHQVKCSAIEPQWQPLKVLVEDGHKPAFSQVLWYPSAIPAEAVFETTLMHWVCSRLVRATCWNPILKKKFFFWDTVSWKLSHK